MDNENRPQKVGLRQKNEAVRILRTLVNFPYKLISTQFGQYFNNFKKSNQNFLVILQTPSSQITYLRMSLKDVANDVWITLKTTA